MHCVDLCGAGGYLKFFESKEILINKEEYKSLKPLRAHVWVPIEVIGNVGIIITKKQSVAVTV